MAVQPLGDGQELGQVPHDVDLDITMDLLYGPIFHRLMVHLPLPDAAHMRKVIVAPFPPSAARPAAADPRTRAADP
ncbi:hypothetical protein [Nonomuraea indica]|uniref:Tetracyclin repressor-like C-terminal domain-containing protein n=1 Tax=Nonomuraea indica TaxID=1581193 RepID=A0ABW8AEQ3_9ACTN